MIDDFMLRAILGGVGVAIAAGPLGSIIVWKRMSFFGDALSHSALLGIVFSLMLNLSQTFGIMILLVFISLLLTHLQKKRSYSSDTLLGIMSHSSLALGLVIISFIDNVKVDLVSFLFGDILAISYGEILWIYVGSATCLAAILYIWRPLILTIVNEDLAQVEGINTQAVRLIFMLMISMLVAFSIKIVGILLVTSLLIIPAAAARSFAQTPEKMAIVASLIGALAVIFGLISSLQWDIPSGPAIVVSAAIIFMLSSFKKH